jgi:hypothetical protein
MKKTVLTQSLFDSAPTASQKWPENMRPGKPRNILVYLKHSSTNLGAMAPGQGLFASHEPASCTGNRI